MLLSGISAQGLRTKVARRRNVLSCWQPLEAYMWIGGGVSGGSLRSGISAIKALRSKCVVGTLNLSALCVTKYELC